MTEKTKYLYENKQIGDVLAQGFAKICQQKPQFPINYLARFLKNYTLNNQQKTHLIDKLQHNKMIDEKLKHLEQQLRSQQQAKKQAVKRKQQEKNKFLASITAQKQPQSIMNEFCQWLCSELGLSAVYVGQLQYQSKKIDLTRQDGEEAHLQLEKQKIVKFNYASNNQQRIIVGQTLGLESVIGKLLTQAPEPQGQQGSPQQGQEGEMKKSENQTPSVYLPSVVGNQELKFFTFPKLGGYFATVMNIKSYLSEKLMDENLLKVQNYRKLLSEYEKEMQEKQAKFRQQYEQKSHSGADEKELEQMQEQFEKQKQSVAKPVQQAFSFIERKFVICADRLGQDREITIEERNELIRMIRHLNVSWQNQEQSQLTEDIEKQLSLFKPSHDQGHDGEAPNYQQQLTTLFQQQEKDILSHEDVQKVKDNQKLMELEINSLKFQKTKEYLFEEKYLKFWNHLLSLNILKYQTILKQFLIILGFNKEDFCHSHTNQLNWLKTKSLLKNSQNSINEKLQALTPRGSKPQQVSLYAKCARINKNLQNLEVLTIANYNIYLALILRLLQTYTKTRYQDRQARVHKIASQRQLRQQKLKEAEQKANEKKQKLQALKAQLEEKGEIQTFDQEAWNTQYDEQNPAIEIPDEVADDIDFDLQEGEQKQQTP